MSAGGVATADGTRIRAGSTLASMIFEYTTNTAKAEADVHSTITISFPANWNFANDKTLFEASAGETIAGAVSVAVGGGNALLGNEQAP